MSPPKKCVCMSSFKKKRFEFAELLLKWAHCLNPGFQEFLVINLSNLNSCQPWGREGNNMEKEGRYLISAFVQTLVKKCWEASTYFMFHCSHTLTATLLRHIWTWNLQESALEMLQILNTTLILLFLYMSHNWKDDKSIRSAEKKKWLKIDNSVSPWIIHMKRQANRY